MLYFVLKVYIATVKKWVVWSAYTEEQEARAEAERLEADGIRYCLEWHAIENKEV